MKSNEELFTTRLAMRHQEPGPRIGDYVDIYYEQGKMPRRERFVHDHGDTIQTGIGGSFYLGDGFVSHSGGCNPAIPKNQLVEKFYDDDTLGWFWFFKNDHARAHNALDFAAPCRVFSYKPRDVWGETA